MVKVQNLVVSLLPTGQAKHQWCAEIYTTSSWRNCKVTCKGHGYREGKNWEKCAILKEARPAPRPHGKGTGPAKPRLIKAPASYEQREQEGDSRGLKGQGGIKVLAASHCKVENRVMWLWSWHSMASPTDEPLGLKKPGDDYENNFSAVTPSYWMTSIKRVWWISASCRTLDYTLMDTREFSSF